MCFYIRDEGGRGEYKEGTERKQERQRGAQRGSGEGAVKRNGGGRRERSRGQRQSGERPRVRTRDRDKRRRERRERTTPSSSSGCDSERRRYLDQSNHAAGSAFYHYFTCFPFTSPSLDDIPRAISRDKKGTRSQKRTPCFLPGSGVLRYPPGTYLGPAETSSRGEPSPVALADSLPACPLHVQRWNLYATLWSSGVAVDFVPPKPGEPKASS